MSDRPINLADHARAAAAAAAVRKPETEDECIAYLLTVADALMAARPREAHLILRVGERLIRYHRPPTGEFEIGIRDGLADGRRRQCLSDKFLTFWRYGRDYISGYHQGQREAGAA